MSRPTGDSPPRMRGATASVAGSRGIVPKPTAGQHTFMLLGDGTWGAQPVAGLPSQTSNSGKLLTTDGTNASWTTTGVLTSLTSPASTNLTLGLGTGGTALTLASSTLAATFAGAVTVGGTTVSVQAAGGGVANVDFLGNTGSPVNGRIQYDQVANMSGQLFFQTANAGSLTTKLTLSNTGAATFAGAVSVGTGAAVGGATAGAGGLAFPAIAVGVADANTLDDYEEGTWTPTLAPATSGTITVASPNLCGYTKIGRVVTVNGVIEASAVSVPVGAFANIGNLPFPSNANVAQRSVGTVRGFSLTTGALNSTMVITSSTQTAVLYIDASLFQAASQIYFQLTYTV